jgi:hypothetical protein
MGASFAARNAKLQRYVPYRILVTYLSGIELVLIGESTNLAEEFGYVGTQLEKEEKSEESSINSDLLYKELGLSKEKHPVEPLTRGQWR